MQEKALMWEESQRIPAQAAIVGTGTPGCTSGQKPKPRNPDFQEL